MGKLPVLKGEDKKTELKEKIYFLSGASAVNGMVRDVCLAMHELPMVDEPTKIEHVSRCENGTSPDGVTVKTTAPRFCG